MNQQSPTFSIMNPLQNTINEAEDIIAQMQDAATSLEFAIAEERGWQSKYREALEAYEVAEYEELAEVIIMAQQKEGPLAGIAVSGKGYDIVLTNLKNQLRKGALAHLWNKAEQIRLNYAQAQVDLEQVETRFNALRKVIDIKAQVLRASTI